ncbi:MAG: hypothetical protein OXU23_24090 [Candidatus Poribacteria bacterium]|nr:hypothetical protein [Candidatus Poribacteria bacterium]MDE0466050.1 hypothetical protein [Candidatus Poribacteria bacterium]
MRIISTFHILTIFMVVLMFSSTFSTFAQRSFVRKDVIATAKADADKDINKFVWFGKGAAATN